MTRSIHDNLLVSYEVECEARTITLRTEKRLVGKPTERTNVHFVGVEGYHFENDAFGNIIFGMEEVPLEQLLSDYGQEIVESYHMAGSPGPWAANLESAVSLLRNKAIQAFVLSSSYGLSGWVLAREVAIVPAQQGAELR
jgi:hypothetical protein